MTSGVTQLRDLTKTFLSDGGLETTLVFLEGHDLPCFASCHLLANNNSNNNSNNCANDDMNKGYAALENYYRRYLKIANDFSADGFIFETPTWRANSDWLTKIGFAEPSQWDMINQRAVELVMKIKKEREDSMDSNKATPNGGEQEEREMMNTSSAPAMIISGVVGPRGDGYVTDSNKMTAESARDYHSKQVAAFAATGCVDIITATTMNYVEEAMGVALAAMAHKLPAVISFTVETNGLLADGHSLKEAIEAVDAAMCAAAVNEEEAEAAAGETNTAATAGATADRGSGTVLYYMINCAHPTHFRDSLHADIDAPSWTKRIGGIRANASCKSHAELDEATELDRGCPKTLGSDYKALKGSFPHLRVFGGCCGTDEEHVVEMARNVLGTERAM